jgi:transposase
MLSDVQQKTIAPLIQRAIAPGSTVSTDEYNIYSRLADWGYEHQTVNQGAGEYARDKDGDGLR